MRITGQEIWDGFSDLFLFGIFTSEEGKQANRRRAEFMRKLKEGSWPEAAASPSCPGPPQSFISTTSHGSPCEASQEAHRPQPASRDEEGEESQGLVGPVEVGRPRRYQEYVTYRAEPYAKCST